MTLNYINNVIEKNDFILHNVDKKNYNFFLKEFNGTYNQSCITKPLFIDEEKLALLLTSNKFNSTIIRRKHVYKKGYYVQLFQEYQDIVERRMPSSFLFEKEIIFIGNNDYANNPLVDLQYHNNIHYNYYRRLYKNLLKTYYRSSNDYIWNIFIKRYELIFSLNILRSIEVLQLSFSQPVLEIIIKSYWRKILKFKIKEILKKSKNFYAYIYKAKRAGFCFRFSEKSIGFIFFDKIMPKFLSDDGVKVDKFFATLLVGFTFKFRMYKQRLRYKGRNYSSAVLRLKKKQIKALQKVLKKSLKTINTSVKKITYYKPKKKFIKSKTYFIVK